MLTEQNSAIFVELFTTSLCFNLKKTQHFLFMDFLIIQMYITYMGEFWILWLTTTVQLKLNLIQSALECTLFRQVQLGSALKCTKLWTVDNAYFYTSLLVSLLKLFINNFVYTFALFFVFARIFMLLWFWFLMFLQYLFFHTHFNVLNRFVTKSVYSWYIRKSHTWHDFNKNCKFKGFKIQIPVFGKVKIQFQ